MEEIKMKDSGIKWIGKIPEDWDIKKIKYCTKFINGFAFEGDDLSVDGNFPVIRIGDIKNGALSYEECLYTMDNKGLSLYKILPNDILIAMSGATTGKVGFINNDKEAYINQRVGIIRSDISKFLFYVLSCDEFLKYIELTSYGSAQPNISSSDIGEYPFALPPTKEILKIVNILDKKCADIDEIISKTEKQIETLEQYKKSFITESVTKGLNPHVEYKKSGIEFITKIPMHWEMKRVINVLKQSLTDGPHETPELYDDGIPFVSAEAVSTGNGKINFDNIRGYISEDYYKQCCKKYVPKLNDVYMIKSGATTGRIAIVDTDKKFTIWSPLAAFRANDKVMNAKFLYYSLMANYFQKQVELGWTYGTQQNIGMRTLEHLKIVKPPIDEQKEIVKFLDEKCKKIEDVITQQNGSLETLKKYKQSLIYEYVTGKKRV